MCVIRLESMVLIGAIFGIGLNHIASKVKLIFSYEFFIWKIFYSTWSELKQRGAPFLEGQFLTSRPNLYLNA